MPKQFITAIAVLLTALPAVADDYVLEKVIGIEFPGRYKHPASFTEIPETGELLLSYYGGDGEYQDNSKVWAMRKPIYGDTWTKPRVIADTPFRAEGNPVVWTAPDGKVWLFYVQRYGDTWSQSRIKCKVSYDNAHTWSDSFMVALEQGMMVRSRPIVLNDGDYLLPIYHETGSDRENVGDDTTSLFIRFDSEGTRWEYSNKIYSRTGNLQPSPVQITDDYLVSYSRRGGGYDPIDDGYLVRSESRDGGRTWSRGTDSQFPNPNAATDFIKLANGHLLLIYNDNMNDRTPLNVAISEDNDKTYPHRKVIGSGENTYAYPVALQSSDGRIHIIYTTNNRTTIMHAHFSESYITE